MVLGKGKPAEVLHDLGKSCKRNEPHGYDHRPVPYHPKGFGMLKTTVCPVVVSHANAKKICDHYRNLTDDQLKALRENGGLLV